MTRRTFDRDGVWREQREKLDALAKSGQPVKVRRLPYPPIVYDRAPRTRRTTKETDMTTIVSIKTVDGDTEKDWKILVGDVALAKVLRKFNVTANVEVDATKVLCAALIQQMLDLQAASKSEADPHKGGAIARTAAMAITDLEKVQMLCVKANFAEA